MSIKGYLKSNRGLFQLLPKVTTIGREGCDLVIQSPDVDQQHALIEYVDSRGGYVIQDLNTSNGTYVNDCRVQNAAVCLAAGDIVRYGFTSLPYELLIDFGNGQPQTAPLGSITGQIQQQQQQQQQQVQQQQVQQQQVQLVRHDSFTSQHSNASFTPENASGWQTQNIPRVQPPVAMTLRARPLSAESLLQRQRQAPPSLAVREEANPQLTFRVSPEPDTSAPSRGVSWQPVPPPSAPNRAQTTVEGDRKDSMIRQLSQEVSDLRQKLQQILQSGSGGNVDLIQSYCQLEAELGARNMELQCLREQISRLRLTSTDSPAGFKHELNEKMQELNNVKNEMERAKKDKNITGGLVAQMQKDMQAKDTTVSRMTREVENLKRELREKDQQVQALGNKFQRVKDQKNTEEENEAKEKELISLREKFKLVEAKLQQNLDEINFLKTENENANKLRLQNKEEDRKIKSEMENLKEKHTELQRLETSMRVDIQQSATKLEKLRGRCIQLGYSAPGVVVPKTELSDDQILEQLGRVVETGNTASKKISDLASNTKTTAKAKAESAAAQQASKKLISESEVRARQTTKK